MATKERTPAAILKAIDKEVEARGKAVLAELDHTAKITQLVSEARRAGVAMSELTQHVQRMDKRERELKPITRQAIDTMVAVHEQRRPARTTRASRRRREPKSEPAGKINTDALK